MNAPDYLDNHSAVIAFYGYWPSFHDAEVPEYRRPSEADPSLGFTLHTWRMTDEVNERGYFVLQDHSLVSFHFDGIHDADIESFQAGNILFGLTFHRGDDLTLFRVELDSAMNMSGAFSASSGRVLSIVRCDSNGTPA